MFWVMDLVGVLLMSGVVSAQICREKCVEAKGEVKVCAESEKGAKETLAVCTFECEEEKRGNEGLGSFLTKQKIIYLQTKLIDLNLIVLRPSRLPNAS